MFETLESRQFLSAAAPAAPVDTSPVSAPSAVDSAKKTEYLVVKLKEVFIDAIQTTPPRYPT